MAQEKEIKISTHIISEIAIKANPTLLDILLSNLISNAIRHTSAQREVKIKIENKSVTISNPGEPFNFPNKIFDRFNRESRTAQGNGLGLAIVKKICDSDDLRLTYLYSDGSHHFKVEV
jgi:signal transduction histidine kinase